MKKIKNNVQNEIRKVWKSNNFDPSGSYTGNNTLGKMPIQDQDDL